MEREREERAPAAPIIVPDFLAMLDLERPLPSAAAREAYRGEAPSDSAAPDIWADLPTDRQSILAELDLHPGLMPADLARIRRRFARDNHPDRMPPALHSQARTRMPLANALIDEAERSACSGTG